MTTVVQNTGKKSHAFDDATPLLTKDGEQMERKKMEMCIVKKKLGRAIEKHALNSPCQGMCDTTNIDLFKIKLEETPRFDDENLQNSRGG